LVGDRDDWTRASWCQEMMARRDGQGSPVELTVYPGATHAFNFPGAPREYLGTISNTIRRPRRMRGSRSADFYKKSSMGRGLPTTPAHFENRILIGSNSIHSHRRLTRAAATRHAARRANSNLMRR